MERIKPGISSNLLKLIAVISMTIDHFAAGVIYGLITNYGHREYIQLYYNCRYIGRLAFPIFAYLIVQGYLHTKNVYKFIGRLGIFALISEVPFDMMAKRTFFDISHQNVFFTLFLAVVAIYGMESCYKNYTIDYEYRVIGAMIVFSVASLISYFGKTDYAGIGVFVIVTIYIFKSAPVFSVIVGPAFMIIWEYINAIGENKTRYFEVATLFSIPLLMMYNKKRGHINMKWFFYIFYPVHLLIIGFICMRYLYG